MHKRTNRLVVAAVLAAAGIAGGFFVFSADRAAESILASSTDVAARLERMVATASEIASAQQAYVAPGQPSQPWFEQSAALLQQFAADLTAVRPRLRSDNAMRVADALSDGLHALVTIDGKARLDLQESQSLLAADLIFSEGRDAVAMLIASIRGLAAAEHSTAAAGRASLARRHWGLLAIVGLVWLGGLLLLLPLPTELLQADGARMTIDLREHGAKQEAADSTPVPPAIDLNDAAQVCMSLAQVAEAGALQAVLARAAEVLNARGIILWMGAGEGLFPALSCGYDQAMVKRLGPLARDAANATAEAWRTGKTCTVPSDLMSHGAVAVPLFGIDGCVGIFAAELRHGREGDPSTRAVAMMFAAQLAGIVPAWPAASVAATAVRNPGPMATSGLA